MPYLTPFLNLIFVTIEEMCIRDRSGGGVTLSGGEVMTADMEFVEELCKRLRKLGITVTIDTCGQAPWRCV